MSIETINDYFPLITSGKMTAEEATQDCINRGLTYALRFFSPQCDDDMPYWDMLKTKVYDKFCCQIEEAPREVEDIVACDCGCIIWRNFRMVASRGTSCPDCYDRMSD